MRISRDRVLLFLKGMAMGMADSVPGVSGGTIALITGIYEELVDSLKSLGWHALVVWKKEGGAAAWRHINGNFLVTLLAGILVSLSLLARLILFVMESWLPFLLAFFGGLVLASIWFVGKHISRWTVVTVLLSAAGVGLMIWLSEQPVRNVSPALAWYFLYGAVAVCAMILPGISGAFLLVILGAYGAMLEALIQFDLQVLLVFAAGCICGLVLFSRVLSWLLHHYHEQTLALLIGILAGSLYTLWPWRVPVESTLNGYAVSVFTNVSPGAYSEITGQAFSPLPCVLLVFLGVGLVLLLENIAAKD